MIDIREVDNAISALPQGSKIKDLDALIASYKGNHDEIGFDKKLLMASPWLQRAFFFHNVALIKDQKEKFLYIDKYKEVFSSWFCTDQLISLIKKCDPDFMLSYAGKYIKSKDTYTRRWGYVMFIFHPSKKDESHAKSVLKLLHNDSEHDVQMAEGWLLCELAIFHPQLVYNYLATCPLDYSVASKAISKIYDSFRIDEEWTSKFIGLRPLYHQNN